MIDYTALIAEERRARQLARKHPQYKLNSRIVMTSQTNCYLCKLPVDVSLRLDNPNARDHQYSPWYPEIDHIMPIKLGGHPWDVGNLGLTHRRCNGIKGAKTLSQLAAEPINPFAIVKKEWSDFMQPSRKNRLAMMGDSLAAPHTGAGTNPGEKHE